MNVRAGTEVYIITPRGAWSYSDADFSGVSSGQVYKQHKNGKIVLEKGREAQKYNLIGRRGSNLDKVGAEWMAEELGRSVSPRVLIPKSPEAAAWVKENVAKLRLEKSARNFARLIEDGIQKRARDPRWLLKNESELQRFAEAMGFTEAEASNG